MEPCTGSGDKCSLMASGGFRYPHLRLYHKADSRLKYLFHLNSICYAFFVRFCKDSFTVWISKYTFDIDYFPYFQLLMKMARPLQ